MRMLTEGRGFLPKVAASKVLEVVPRLTKKQIYTPASPYKIGKGILGLGKVVVEDGSLSWLCTVTIWEALRSMAEQPHMRLTSETHRCASR